jgi:hypothetical protein
MQPLLIKATEPVKCAVQTSFVFPIGMFQETILLKFFRLAIFIVKIVVNTGKQVGTHVGFAAVKLTKLFNIYAS